MYLCVCVRVCVLKEWNLLSVVSNRNVFLMAHKYPPKTNLEKLFLEKTESESKCEKQHHIRWELKQGWKLHKRKYVWVRSCLLRGDSIINSLGGDVSGGEEISPPPSTQALSYRHPCPLSSAAGRPSWHGAYRYEVRHLWLWLWWAMRTCRPRRVRLGFVGGTLQPQ